MGRLQVSEWHRSPNALDRRFSCFFALLMGVMSTMAIGPWFVQFAKGKAAVGAYMKLAHRVKNASVEPSPITKEGGRTGIYLCHLRHCGIAW